MSPDLIRALAKEGTAHGVDVLDAPVTVTRYGTAEEPFVCTMIGADEQATPTPLPAQALTANQVHALLTRSAVAPGRCCQAAETAAPGAGRAETADQRAGLVGDQLKT